jgi:hypothetical protein
MAQAVAPVGSVIELPVKAVSTPDLMEYPAIDPVPAVGLSRI